MGVRLQRDARGVKCPAVSGVCWRNVQAVYQASLRSLPTSPCRLREQSHGLSGEELWRHGGLHLPPLRMRTSRKLKFEAESELEPWHSDRGCKHPNQKCNHHAKTFVFSVRPNREQMKSHIDFDLHFIEEF